MTKGLTGNQLKLIALVTMTLDHIGHYLFPHLLLLRLVGRLAMPIYAFFIAEGCRHTRSMAGYLRTMVLMGLLCSVVTLCAGSLYQSILVTFSMSIGLIFLLEKALNTKSILWYLLFTAALSTVWFVTETLPGLLHGTDFDVDYGFWGAILPVIVWLMPKKWCQLFAAAAVMTVMAFSNPLQLFAFGALVPLALYNGQRGARNLKWLFYWYYPVHLAILNLIAMLL